MFWSFFY
jgi:phosphorylated adapter RNA export protein